MVIQAKFFDTTIIKYHRSWKQGGYRMYPPPEQYGRHVYDAVIETV